MIYVLFDIDETILSVPGGINAKASSVMFKKVFGLNAHEEMIDNIGKTEMGIIKEVLEKLGENVAAPEEAYKVWAQATAQELKSHPVRILPGISELLTVLFRNPKVKLGLLSGNSSWRSEEKLKSAHLDTFFRDPDTKQLNGVFGNMAERRDQLFDIIKQQATAGDRFVIIDDSIIGARMAQTHNLPMIMVATGKATEEQLRPFTPYVFSDFGEGRWEKVVSLIEVM